MKLKILKESTKDNRFLIANDSREVYDSLINEIKNHGIKIIEKEFEEITDDTLAEIDKYEDDLIDIPQGWIKLKDGSSIEIYGYKYPSDESYEVFITCSESDDKIYDFLTDLLYSWNRDGWLIEWA